MQKCKKEGKLTNQTHNNVLACMAEMARSCGLCARVEVSGIFNSVDPASQQRLDLGKPTHLYDMVVSNPVSQEVLSTNKVNVR